MALSDLSDKEAVIAATREFDEIGRDAFLRKYGFGEARQYVLLHGRREYDSKAIAGAAYGYQFPARGPLKAGEFSGGEATVKKKLASLGFIVVGATRRLPADDFLVLVENEVTTDGTYDFWKDITGVQYHYPNAYKGRIQSGAPFLYYRGALRKSGKRGRSEYFGRGVIGTVWQDAETSGSRPHWYASIEDYEPFAEPVPARRPDGTTYEVPPGNSGNRHFGVGVRRITSDVYHRIVSAAGLPPKSSSPPSSLSQFAPVDESRLEPVTGSTAALLVRSAAGEGNRGGDRGARSRYSKAIGDRAEELVFRRLQSLGKRPKWLSQEGLTPGWDIEYTEVSGRVAVEVKGTTGDRFTSVELTANEWAAALRERANYHLYLVARCGSSAANLEVIVDPASAVERGELKALPAVWAISRP